MAWLNMTSSKSSSHSPTRCGRGVIRSHLIELGVGLYRHGASNQARKEVEKSLLYLRIFPKLTPLLTEEDIGGFASWIASS